MKNYYNYIDISLSTHTDPILDLYDWGHYGMLIYN